MAHPDTLWPIWWHWYHPNKKAALDRLLEPYIVPSTLSKPLLPIWVVWAIASSKTPAKPYSFTRVPMPRVAAFMALPEDTRQSIRTAAILGGAAACIALASTILAPPILLDRPRNLRLCKPPPST